MKTTEISTSGLSRDKQLEIVKQLAKKKVISRKKPIRKSNGY